MSADPYSPLVRQYFFDTAHAGDLGGAVTIEIEEQGVRLRLAATHKSGKIQALRFRAWACPHLIAACESVCADYEGRPIDQLKTLQAADIMLKLSVPTAKTGRILVLEDAVRSLGRNICDSPVPQ